MLETTTRAHLGAAFELENVLEPTLELHVRSKLLLEPASEQHVRSKIRLEPSFEVTFTTESRKNTTC